MGELIDMRIPFNLRRLQADVRRAEQDYDQFHEKFERRLLVGRQAEQQQALNALCNARLPLPEVNRFIMHPHSTDIILPPKPEED